MRFPSYLQPQMNSRNAAQTRILLWDLITAETRRGSNQTATSNNCFPERKRGGWVGVFSFPTQALASKTLPVVAGTLCRCRGGRMM